MTDFSGLPNFEGESVDFSYAKLSVPRLDLEDHTLAIDQDLAMVVRGKVTRIDYTVNRRTGKLERTHVISIDEAVVVDSASDDD